MNEFDEKHVKELHAEIAALKERVEELTEANHALTGELIKKNTEVDYPAPVQF